MENHCRKIICFQLFQIPTDVFEQQLVRVENSSLRVNDSDELRYAIDDQAQIEFAFAEAFLSALPVFNVNGNAIPANHATTVIPQGLSGGAKPAIDVIEPAHTLLYVARLTSFNGMQPCPFRSLD